LPCRSDQRLDGLDSIGLFFRRRTPIRTSAKASQTFSGGVTKLWSKRFVMTRRSHMIRPLKITALVGVCAVALAACGDTGSTGGQARNGVWAAGSSTLFPFATRVAE